MKKTPIHIKATLLFLCIILFAIENNSCSLVINSATNYSFEIITPKYIKGSIDSWEPFSVPILLGGTTFEEMSSCKELNPIGSAPKFALVVGIYSGLFYFNR